jgi:hypothetical protein
MNVMPAEDQADDLPMSEAQWEAHFRESDLKAAKFEELLETFHGQPDCQEKVAREMGWTWLVDALQREKEEGTERASMSETDSSDDDAEEELDDSWLDDFADDDDDDDFDDDDFDDDEDASLDEASEQVAESKSRLRQIPAYAAAMALAYRVSDALRPLMEGEDPDDERIRLLSEAYITAHQAAVNIAGGHAMGYDEDVLCGNIVKNRMSLAAIVRCREAWGELIEQRIVTTDFAEPLINEMRRVQGMIEERIAELRARVWW